MTLVEEPPVLSERHRRSGRWPAVVLPLALYVASRAMTLVAGAVAMAMRPGSDFVSIFAAWDGKWYSRIITEGYPSVIPANANGKAVFSQIPFFPAYPLLARAVDWLTPGSAKMTAIVVAMLLGAIATVVFWYLCRSFWGDTVANRATAIFCFFPGAWVFSFAYSDGLMLILAMGTLVLLQRREWLLAGIVGALATTSRPNAILLVGCAAVASAIAIAKRREWRSLVAPAIMPIGALAFMGYLWQRTGEIGAWFRVQDEAWEERVDFGRVSANFMKEFFLHPLSSGDIFIIGVMTIVAAVMVVLLFRARLPAIYTVYALGTLALSATSAVLLTRPRFVFLAFPLTMALGRFLRGRMLALVLVLFALFQALLVVWYGYTWPLRLTLYPLPP